MNGQANDNGHAAVRSDATHSRSPELMMPADKLGDATKKLQGSATCAAYGLLAFMWAAWLWWVLAHWLSPLTWFQDIEDFPKSGWMDTFEGTVLIYVMPITLLAVAANLYLAIPRRLFKNGRLAVEEVLARVSRTILWVGRPFGIVSVGEFFWIVIVSGALFWYLGRSSWQTFNRIELRGPRNGRSVLDMKLDKFAERLGWLAFMVMLVLLLPITRGSALLRITGISYVQGVKYHRWFAKTHLAFAALHAVGYWAVWIKEDVFWEKVWMFQEYAVNNVAGEITVLIGFVMWLTALGPVRRRSFEVFFYTHQMYLLYFLFLTIHTKERVLMYAFPSFVLFGLDRLLRAVQSHATVEASSVSLLPNGCFEITIPTSSGVKYKPLDNILLNVPAVSKLQWHPFSVTSSPLDGACALSVMIKPGGTWTNQLAAHLEGHPDEPLRLGVEGPYGQEQDFLNRYDDLVLVAGGIGITPFLSLLKDLAHRCRLDEPSRLPASVTLIWAVHTHAEAAAILETLSLTSICPSLAARVAVNVHVYVTREESADAAKDADVEAQAKARLVAVAPSGVDKAGALSACPMHALVGQGADLWGALLVLVVSGAVFFIVTLFVHTIIDHYDHPYHKTVPFWARALIYWGGFYVGLITSAAFAAAVWYQFRPSTYRQLDTGVARIASPEKKPAAAEVSFSLQPTSVHFGGRPNWDEVFASLVQQQLRGSNAGVIVSGPRSMELAVAAHCSRLSNNFGFSLHGRPQLNFHSITFSL